MRTIIFDFDGTIGDSLKVTIQIGHKLTGHSLLTKPEEIEKLRGLRLIDVARELGIKKYQWPFLLYRGRRLMTKYLGEIQPFSQIDEVLASLHKSGYRLIIMSSNSKRNIDIFLAEHGLATYFEKIYGGVGLFGKAASLRKIMRQNSLSRGEVIYVGDEPRDVEAAKHEQIPCVAVGWGFNTAQMLSEHAPMIVVRTRTQLLKVLEEWGSSVTD